MKMWASAPALLAGLVSALAATSGRAADETRIETVAGYEISRVNDPKDAYPCRMVRGYADPKDNNAAKALGFGELDGVILASLVYQNWKWPAGKTVPVRLSVDRTLIDAEAPFLGNATYLAIKIPVSHLPAFDAGKKIVLGFKDGSAEFDLTGFKPAFEATRRCNRDAAAARAAGRAPEAPAASARVGSGAAAPAPAPAVPPAPRPIPPSAVPAPAATGPVPSEDRAVAYLFGLYDRWAFDACDMRTTAKQRSAFEAKMTALKPEMTVIDADLQKQVPSDPGRCPPADKLETQLGLLLDDTTEDFVAKMDKRATEEFRGIVRPILARLKPPAPAPAAERKPLPSEPRIAAYLLGLTIQDVLQRCDVATTARQRTGLDDAVEALRPEMAEIEPAVRGAIERQACPGPGESRNAERDIRGAIKDMIETSPETFAAAVDARRGGTVMKTVRRIVEAARPAQPVPSQARMSAYLWGLLLQDKIAQCDIPTTARQRAGLDAKVAGMKEEMSAVEGQLRAQIQGQVDGCPKPDKVAEIAAAITLLIDSKPEDFAQEMDRRAAAKPPADPAATPAPAKDAPATQTRLHGAEAQAQSKPASCGQTHFPQSRAALIAALKERLQPLGIQDVVAKPRATANHHGYAMSGADVGLDVDGADGSIHTFSVRQDGDSSKREAEVVLASAAYLVATFTHAPEEKIAQAITARLGAAPVSSGQSEKFDTATVYYTRPDGGPVSVLIDNADAGDCKP